MMIFILFLLFSNIVSIQTHTIHFLSSIFFSILGKDVKTWIEKARENQKVVVIYHVESYRLDSVATCEYFSFSFNTRKSHFHNIDANIFPSPRADILCNNFMKINSCIMNDDNCSVLLNNSRSLSRNG